MRRRDFINRLLSAASVTMGAPLPLRAEAAPVARVGILDPSDPGTYSDKFYWSAFYGQMRVLGYIEDKNVAYHTRWAHGDLARLPDLTKELANLGVNVILARNTPAALAARSVTSQIPIVVPLMADPVGIGLVASLARPAGNVTGLSTVSAELSAKRLELLREIVPQLARVAILWDDTNPAFALAVSHTEAAAKSLGLSLRVLGAQATGSIDNLVSAITASQAQGLIVAIPAGAPLFGGNFTQITTIIANLKLPAVYAEKEYVKLGGLASYGPDYIDLFRRAATYVDKILKGTRPADLPVEEPIKFETVFNLKTAKLLGVDVSPMLLVRADEVIE